jgi:flavin reductase (DIM6/NTAB) family NADH-FMN oxidoreductase RutF
MAGQGSTGSGGTAEPTGHLGVGDGFADVDPGEYRATMGGFASGVSVITVAHEGQMHGMTANAVMSVSLAPPLLAVAIDNRSYTNDVLAEAGHFTVNLLAEGADELALRFARPRARESDLFIDGPYPRSATGDPTLAGQLAHLACRVHSSHVEGDHTLWVGRVAEAQRPGALVDPLLFVRGRFTTVTCRACITRHDPMRVLQVLHDG